MIKNPLEDLARDINDLAGGIKAESINKLARYFYEEYSRNPEVTQYLLLQLSTAKVEDIHRLWTQ